MGVNHITIIQFPHEKEAANDNKGVFVEWCIEQAEQSGTGCYRGVGF